MFLENDIVLPFSYTEYNKKAEPVKTMQRHLTIKSLYSNSKG